jgi:hypothetical protein
MTTIIERLSEQAEKAAPRPWEVLGDEPFVEILWAIPEGAVADDLGGGQIAEVESVANAEVIVAAVNALANLLAPLQVATNQPGPGPIRDHELWQHHRDCRPLDECLCGLSAIRDALAPLLREAAKQTTEEGSA